MSKIVHACHAVVFAGACLLRGCYLKRHCRGIDFHRCTDFLRLSSQESVSLTQSE